MYIYCAYLVMLESQYQLPNGAKRSKTSVVLVVFYVVLYEVRADIVNAYYRCLAYIRYEKGYNMISDRE